MGNHGNYFMGCLKIAPIFSNHQWELKNGNVMMKQWNAVAYFEPTFLGFPPEMTLFELKENSLEQHLTKHCLRVFLVFCFSIKSAGLTGLTPTHGQCGPVRT
jgi:hypothetical protein